MSSMASCVSWKKEKMNSLSEYEKQILYSMQNLTWNTTELS